jgi:hypothetical protein
LELLEDLSSFLLLVLLAGEAVPDALVAGLLVFVDGGGAGERRAGAGDEEPLSFVVFCKISTSCNISTDVMMAKKKSLHNTIVCALLVFPPCQSSAT